MGDFDYSKDHIWAAAIIFPLALCGFICNLTVVVFLRVIPSLQNSFGSLTFSQAVADCIHQAIFAFYLTPTLLLRYAELYSWSEQAGFSLITVYNICGTAHVSISINRFFAVYAPFYYQRLFSKRNTRILICFYWLFGIVSTTILLKFLDCANNLKGNGWIFGFIDTPTCNFVLWYVEFIKYLSYVVVVAALDACSIVRIHLINRRHSKIAQDTVSAMRRLRERNLVYQAALQGIFFLLELVTYFLLGGYARDKWQLFLLTTVSWCLVHGMDGFIVLFFNSDFRRHITKALCSQVHTTTNVINLSGPSRVNPKATSTMNLREETLM